MNSFLRFQVNDVLISYANFEDIKVLYELLKNGLKINLPIDKEGSTPLHLASGIFDEEISLLAVKALLNHSANPNYPDKEGKTSVHVAASLGHKKVLQLLICNGGNILQSSLYGDTSIDLANRLEQFKIVSYLSYLLDTEEYELPEKEGFVSFLVNRQLLEITADLSLKYPSNDSVEYSDFDESDCQLRCESLNNNNFRNVSNHQYHQTPLHNTSHHNETPDEGEDKDKTSLLDEGFSQPDGNDSQNLFDTIALDNCQDLRMDSCNNSKTPLEYYVTPLSSLNSFTTTCHNFTSLSSLNQTMEVDSFFTVVEDYVYKDEEKGVELIERRFTGSLLLPGSSAMDQSLFYTLSEFRGNSESSKLLHEDSLATLTSSIKNLSGKALRNKLRELGFDAGPVTLTTVKILQRHYQRLRNKHNVPLYEDVNISQKYSKELEKFCKNFESDKNCYEDLEDKMCEPFINPDHLSWWRNGTHKTSFNYLLLDPRITKNIALRPKFPVSFDQFRTFLSAIFYIGKGSKTRPYSHLYEALKDSSKYSENRKLRKIKEIWDDDLGVVSLHVFQCTIPVEAWTREACMISAY
ncbi:Ankyrin repeat and LEM domain-containing protein 1, partial [Armadillidium nasatum]